MNKHTKSLIANAIEALGINRKSLADDFTTAEVEKVADHAGVSVVDAYWYMKTMYQFDYSAWRKQWTL